MLRLTMLSFLLVLTAAGFANAQTTPYLGQAGNYVAFSAEGNVINIGASMVVGDLGAEDSAVIGFPPGHYIGTLRDQEDLLADNHKDTLTSAYATLGNNSCGTTLTQTIGNGQTLRSGTYCATSNTTISGTLTLDGHSDTNAVFIFKITGSLSASASSQITLTNGARARNIYWQVTGTTDVRANASFKGSIFGNNTIHLYDQSNVEGRAIAINGNVYLDNVKLYLPGSQLPQLTVLRPSSGETLQGGTQNYQVTFTGSQLTPAKTTEYSFDGGITWRVAGTINSPAFSFSWNVPDTNVSRAFIRVTDANGTRGISGAFAIVANTVRRVVIITPSLDEVVQGGMANYPITWNGTGLTQQKILEYSLDSGASWTIIGVATGSATTFSWNVPDTSVSHAYVRLIDMNGTTGVSGEFTITSNKTKPSIVVTHPTGGELVIGGTRDYPIQWNGTGIANAKQITYSLDGGITWHTIANLNADVNTVSWMVPDTNVSNALVRVTDANGLTGTSAPFSIQKDNHASLVVIHPAAGDTLIAGTLNYQITFTGQGITAQKIVEFSSDGGLSWTYVGMAQGEGSSYTWQMVPMIETTKGLIRILDMNGITGTSGLFTIAIPANTGTGAITMLCLGGLIDNQIPNGKHMTIDWMYQGNVGDSFTIEYSLNGTESWAPITTISTSAAPHIVWTTPSLGYYGNARIRVVSTKGITAKSPGFIIGSFASVASGNAAGLSLSNYPNPANTETTIRFEIPSAAPVTISFLDFSGREVATIASQEYSAGAHEITFDASKLASGAYGYILHAGSSTISGRMNVVR